MNHRSVSCRSLSAAACLALAVAASAQESVDQRLDRIERENRELRARLDRIDASAGAASSASSAGGAQEPPPGFRKVYAIDDGFSFAGYGEMLFTQNSGGTDVADALRAVLYTGYRFDEHWLFHAELEFEHGSTSESSGTTSSGGEVSVEFGYLEYLANEHFSIRTGLVLVPMGLVNELHEPTAYLPAVRAETETRILPTTWRELGAELIGTFEDVEVKWFVGTGLDGEEFDVAGVRGGRQKGNRAAADDWATALRCDYKGIDGLVVGASGLYQQAGQDGLRGTTPIPELDTVIVEGHADWRCGPWQARGLYATTFSDDALEFATATNRRLAERMYGAYGELGCDLAGWLCPGSKAAVIPYVRWEHIDTQAVMPEGFAADPARDSTILTFGVHWRPIDRVVFKVDFESWDDSYDRFHVAMGYVF
jgi:hypothetical protein